jgi:hypothetical protein
MRSFDDIKFFDGIFNEEICEQIYNIAFSEKKWETQRSNSESRKLFWMLRVEHDRFFTEECFNSVKNIIGDNYIIKQVYFNAQAACQSTDPHLDSESEDDYTFLYYANTTWDIKWGGQTSFINGYYDEKSSQLKRFSGDSNKMRTISYMPVPNSALFFPSNILHFASGPDRQMDGLRLTLAYKLTKKYDFREKTNVG